MGWRAWSRASGWALAMAMAAVPGARASAAVPDELVVIHPAGDAGLCLSAETTLTVAACKPGWQRQQWTLNRAGDKLTILSEEGRATCPFPAVTDWGPVSLVPCPRGDLAAQWRWEETGTAGQWAVRNGYLPYYLSTWRPGVCGDVGPQPWLLRLDDQQRCPEALVQQWEPEAVGES